MGRSRIHPNVNTNHINHFNPCVELKKILASFQTWKHELMSINRTLESEYDAELQYATNLKTILSILICKVAEGYQFQPSSFKTCTNAKTDDDENTSPLSKPSLSVQSIETSISLTGNKDKSDTMVFHDLDSKIIKLKVVISNLIAMRKKLCDKLMTIRQRKKEIEEEIYNVRLSIAKGIGRTDRLANNKYYNNRLSPLITFDKTNCKKIKYTFDVWVDGFVVQNNLLFFNSVIHGNYNKYSVLVVSPSNIPPYLAKELALINLQTTIKEKYLKENGISRGKPTLFIREDISDPTVLLHATRAKYDLNINLTK